MHSRLQVIGGRPRSHTAQQSEPRTTHDGMGRGPEPGGTKPPSAPDSLAGPPADGCRVGCSVCARRVTRLGAVCASRHPLSIPSRGSARWRAEPKKRPVTLAIVASASLWSVCASGEPSVDPEPRPHPRRNRTLSSPRRSLIAQRDFR
jgi:hypothetical protein